MSYEDFSPNGPFEKSPLSFGEWTTEAESVLFIEDILKQSGLFTIYKEVEGRLLHTRPFCDQKAKFRIDFILSPTPRLRDAGWLGGAIGLECKKSGIKINEPFAQVDDYTHCVWRLPSGFMFMCDYYFIWPYGKSYGFLASQMQQKRIGTLWHDHTSDLGKKLKFLCGNNLAIKYDFRSKQIKVSENLHYGFKTGSR